MSGKEDGESKVKEHRNFRRVKVGLSATVVLSREEVYLAHTIDVSEGGIKLEHYFGPPLKEGRLVGVNVHGIVTASESDDENENFLMRVVRSDGDELALHFVAD